MTMLTNLRNFFHRFFGAPKAPDEVEVIHEVEHQDAYAAEFVPYDENLLEHSRTQWQFGDWESLVKLDRDTLQHHPDRAKLALLAAAAHMQQGNAQAAQQFTRLAQDWGCSKKLISQILVAGVHNTLGRAAALSGQQNRALSHFERSISIGTPGSEVRLIAQARVGEQFTQLGLSGNGSRVEMLSQINTALDNEPPEPDKAKRIILVAGINRSGSTWLFNCIRFLLNLKCPDVYSVWVKDYDPANPSPIHLIKIHEPDDNYCALADEIYTSRRDIREIAGSMIRMGWKQKAELVDHLDWIVNTVHPYWLGRTNFEVEYSEILAQPQSLVEKIGHSLGIHVDVLQADAICKELAEMVPGETYDKVTQLHPNHLSYGQVDYADLLGQDQWEKITDRYQEWLARYGYLVPA